MSSMMTILLLSMLYQWYMVCVCVCAVSLSLGAPSVCGLELDLLLLNDGLLAVG